MAIWRMRIACWLRKATNMLSICNTYLLSHCKCEDTDALQMYVYV